MPFGVELLMLTMITLINVFIVVSATQFALGMGFREESLATNDSVEMWTQWKGKKCQPNFRKVTG